MSMRYKGATLSSTAPVTTGGESGTAPGAWTLEQQAQAQAAGLWPLQPTPKYIEDVFSTYLYTGNETARSIVNNISLSTKGGMVWIKDRTNAIRHTVFDSARGAVNYFLIPNSTAAQNTDFTNNVTSFNADGFSLGTGGNENGTGRNYVSWTFREQAKFFDVVTYTGNGVSGRQIAHNLGSTPGFVVVKNITNANSWYCWHRSLPNSGAFLETTDAFSPGLKYICGTVNDTVFSVDSAGGSVNGSGENYVAYLFAHDAGGFGLSGTDNVISCGSWTGSTSSVNINLGYEPQWLLIRRTDDGADWFIFDVMRQMSYSNVAALNPNAANAEALQGAGYFQPTPTGFTVRNGWSTAGSNWIYIAIRKGPMKTPTVGTSVFSPNLAAAQGQLTTGFPVDLGMWNYRTGYSENTVVNDRLRGVSSTNAVTSANNLITSSSVPEQPSQGTQNWNNTGLYAVTGDAVFYSFRRAPSFFDEVCYTGTGANRTVTHNLAAVPELMIVKNRVETGGERWTVYTTATTATKAMYLDGNTQAVTASVFWNNTDPTATVFSVGTAGNVNTNTQAYVAYLFATCPGVSKVGSYTGTGATQTIACGFAGGARFVLIKRTDSTGDWYVWDSARGIVAGNDPYILLNSVAAEVTGTDYVDTAATGFEISSTAPAAINANGGSYIFLAIA